MTTDLQSDDSSSVFRATERREDELLARIGCLKDAIQESDRSTNKEIDLSHDKMRDLRRTIEYLQEKTTDDARKAALVPKRMLAQQQRILEEHSKMVNYLKTENSKARKLLSKYEKRLDKVYGKTNELEESNSSLGFYLDEESEQKGRMKNSNRDIKSRLKEEKATNKELQSMVGDMQDKYMEEASKRLQVQKALSSILKTVSAGSTDSALKKDVVAIALACEAEAKAIMTVMDEQAAGDVLQFSDESSSSGN